MINVNNNLAKKINQNTLKLAKGVTSFPFFVPQFREGGEVDLPNKPTLNQRLPQAASNAATQSQQLRANVNGQYKSVLPKPSSVNLGDTSVKPFPQVRGLGGAAVDLGLAQKIAGNAAERYSGYGADKVKQMFPKYAKGGEVDEKLEQDEYGMIEGPGTGTSDDIPADLEQGDYIIPAEVVEYYGAEPLLNMIQYHMPQQQEEGNKVEAMVSNGEIRVPKEVVQKLGPDLFDSMKAVVGTPDLSKEVEGKPGYAYPGLVEDEEKNKYASPQQRELLNSVTEKPETIAPNVYSNPTKIDKSKAGFSGGLGDLFNNQPNLATRQLPQNNDYNQAVKNVEASNVAVQRRQADAQKNFDRPSNPNIYGPGGVNYGPNPSQEQINNILGTRSAEQSSQDNLNQFKQYLQAQADIQREADNRANIDQQFYLDRYGTTAPGAQRLDAGVAIEPQRLSAQERNVNSTNQINLGISQAVNALEREKLNRPSFNARINEEGTPVVYQENGIGAPEYNAQLNAQQRDNGQQKSNLQIAQEILNDPSSFDKETVKRAKTYFDKYYQQGLK